MAAGRAEVPAVAELLGRILLKFRGGGKMSALVAVATWVTGGVSFEQKLDCAWEWPMAVLYPP